MPDITIQDIKDFKDKVENTPKDSEKSDRSIIIHVIDYYLNDQRPWKGDSPNSYSSECQCDEADFHMGDYCNSPDCVCNSNKPGHNDDDCDENTGCSNPECSCNDSNIPF